MNIDPRYTGTRYVTCYTYKSAHPIKLLSRMEPRLTGFSLSLAVILIAFCGTCYGKPGFPRRLVQERYNPVLQWESSKREPYHGKKSVENPADSPFHIDINSTVGSYSITINKEIWLKNSPTFIVIGRKYYSTEDGSLKMIRQEMSAGYDTLGEYASYHMDFQPSAMNLTISYAIRAYDGFAIFDQMFPQDVPVGGTPSGKDSVCTGFPSFTIDKKPGLGYLAYGGIMVGDTNKHIGMWGPDMHVQSGVDSGPLVLFNKQDDTLIISPFREFMAASAHYDKQGANVAWGLLGSAKSIPKDFHYSTIIFYGNSGVRKGMESWGRTMRKYYNREESFRFSDMTNNYLGYWTDNGAFYYYNTEPGKNYQQTLIDVKRYADKMNIPYRYIQYDSWWYYKGPKDGVTEWVAMPSIFPDGSYSVWNATGLPVSAHNRWWSDKTLYAKQNGGKYNFVVEPQTSKAIPIDQAFWDDLMQSSRKWGLIVYEQDWLNTEFDSLEITGSDLTIGREWLMQMGKGAAKNGITIQYCMAPSRAALQALEIPVVSQARVSNDYQPGEDNWKIGISSMLADAIGLAPFKDNFFTTTYQPGNPYHKNESHPALHSLVATLSTGPVGPSDKIDASDVQLIMKSCNSDGLILKPSRPIFSIDAQLHQAAFKDGSGPSGEVYSTESVISGYHFGIIMAADMGPSDSYAITPSSAGFTGPDYLWPTSIAYSYDATMATFTEFTDDAPLKLTSCTKDDFCLYYTSAILKGGDGSDIVIYGELDKWVPMSPQRVTYIGITSDDLHLHLKGAVGETVVMTFGDPVEKTWFKISCVIPQDGTTRMRVNRKDCA